MAADDLEVFPTPLNLTRAIVTKLNHLNFEPPDLIIEPSAGSGSFVRAARETWPASYIVAVEPRVEETANLTAAGANEIHSMMLEDFLKTFDDFTSVKTLVLGNPPFSKATDHIELLMARLGAFSKLSFLLRSSFLASKDRYQRLYQKPPIPLNRGYCLTDSWNVVPRPGFSADGGTDMAEYNNLLFTKGLNNEMYHGGWLAWDKS